MVIHLATALDVPLRHRKELLDSAGFAPAYRQRGLDDKQLRQIHQVLERLLAAHEPYPAYIVDRLWNLVAANTVATRVMAMAMPAGTDPALFAGNVVRLMLHPQGARHSVANWEAVAGVLWRRLVRDVAEQPGDDALGELLAEARGYLADIDRTALTEGPPQADELLVPIVLRTPLGDLETFTTIATIGAAHDVTLEELRIETLLPATEEAEAILREIAAG